MPTFQPQQRDTRNAETKARHTLFWRSCHGRLHLGYQSLLDRAQPMNGWPTIEAGREHCRIAFIPLEPEQDQQPDP